MQIRCRRRKTICSRWQIIVRLLQATSRISTAYAMTPYGKHTLLLHKNGKMGGKLLSLLNWSDAGFDKGTSATKVTTMTAVTGTSGMATNTSMQRDHATALWREFSKRHACVTPRCLGFRCLAE